MNNNVSGNVLMPRVGAAPNNNYIALVNNSRRNAKNVTGNVLVPRVGSPMSGNYAALVKNSSRNANMSRRLRAAANAAPFIPGVPAPAMEEEMENNNSGWTLVRSKNKPKKHRNTHRRFIKHRKTRRSNRH